MTELRKPKRFTKAHIELEGYFMNFIDFNFDGKKYERGVRFTDKRRPAFWFIVPEYAVEFEEEND